MASETAIANTAAVLIGTESRLLSLDDDSTLARTLKAVWDSERRATLRDGAWNFAVAREALAAASGAAPYPYAAAFPLPAACLRLLEVLNADLRDTYQLEGGRILADSAGPVYIRYLADVPELAQWDDAAASAFARRLALTCGPRIAGSTFSISDAEQGYTQALARAKGVDAAENPPIPQEESDWVLARMGSGYGWPR